MTNKNVSCVRRFPLHSGTGTFKSGVLQD